MDWSHNFDITATEGSDGFQSMGEDSPIGAAGIASLFVALDLLEGDKTLDRMTASIMVQRWAMDQMIRNAVTIAQPGQTQKFIRLPGGAYNPPPGSAAQLTEPGGNYLLRTKGGIEIAFGAGGKIESWQDLNGVTLSFTYSGDRLSSVSNGLGRTLALTYDTSDRVTQVSDGTGRSVSYGYDAEGNLTSVTDAAGEVTTLAYSAPGLLSQIFHPANPTNAFVDNLYDSFGRVETQTSARGSLYQYFFADGRSEEVDPEPFGNSQILHFNPRGKLLRRIDRAGKELVSEYDGQDRIVRTIAPEGNSVTYEYDAAHNPVTVTRHPKPGSPLQPLVDTYTYEPIFNQVTSITDALGRVTAITVDPTNGNILRIDAPQVDGQTPSTVMTYTALGQLETLTDPEGKVTRYGYATNGDLVSIVEDEGGLDLTTTLTYDAVGDVVAVTDPRGNVTTSDYDELRRLVLAVAPSPLDFETSFDYDPNGNLLEARRDTGDPGDPLQIISHVYDTAGNRTSTTDPSGNVTALTYDELDRVETIIDAEQRETEYIYDAVGRLQMSIDALGQVAVENSYSDNGLRSSLRDANGNLTSFEYDGFDRLVETVYPDGSSEQLTYDAVSNVATRTTRAGDVFSYLYDALDRLRSETVPGFQDPRAYDYDLLGRLTQADDGTVSLLRSYDSAGRLIGESRGGLSVGYDYDAAGNRTRITWPDGYFVDYAYDALDRMTSVTENGATPLVAYGYDALSRRSQASYASGVVTGHGYAANDDLLSLEHALPGGSVETFAYGYNGVGERTSLEVSEPAYLQVPTQAQEIDYTANDLNQYQAVGAATLVYDGNGNLSDDGVDSYSYDALGRLTGADTPLAAASYGYGPLDRRISKDVDGTVTQFLHDGLQEIADYDGAGTLQRRYVPGAAFGEVAAIVSGATGARIYPHYDALGSTVALSNDAGAVLERLAYGPFGEDTASPISQAVFRYTGQRFDPEAGLYHYRARAYSPALGRFLQPDPMGFVDGPNLYAYVGNDPLNVVDPTGEFANFAIGAFTSVALGVVIRGATGGDAFDLSAIATDAALGAVGAGIVSKATQLYRLRGLGLSASQRLTATSTVSRAPTSGTFVLRAGGTAYVGQSGNLAVRSTVSAAERNLTKAPVVRIGVSGEKASREVAEHRILQQLGGAKSPGVLNTVNPISRSRQGLLSTPGHGAITGVYAPGSSLGTSAAVGGGAGQLK